MANYKAIKGFTIQEVDTDPTLIEGQVWYNATTKKLKAAGLAAGTWATGTAVNSGRASGIMSGGTYTAAIIAGGNLLGLVGPFTELFSISSRLLKTGTSYT